MRKYQAFISHSSVDKKFVRRLAKDLTQHNINVWVDENSIKAGQNIADKIQSGIDESDFLIILLTSKSVQSGWVRTEWQTKFFDQVSRGNIAVIPALLEKCEVPAFLRGIKYADFTDEYEIGLASILSSLTGEEYIPESYSNIFDTVADILDSLRNEFIAIPFFGKIPIIKTLKRIPRSGKHLRLRGLHLSTGSPIPSRSLYDHILSVAHTADCLYNVVDHGLRETDILNLSRCIAFHEINEVLLGDIPAFTDLTDRRRRTARIESEDRLRAVPSHSRERITNDFIWMFLSTRQKEAFNHYIEIASDNGSSVYKFYKALDKIDPIIGIWRYINTFRGRLGQECSIFVAAMDDFFYNPEPHRILTNMKVDERIIGTLTFLQNKKKALRYYIDKDLLLEHSDMLSLQPGIVKSIIEGKEMLFVDSRHIQ